MEASLSFGKRRIVATVTTQDGEGFCGEGMVMWTDGETTTLARAKGGDSARTRALD
jgi:hypothetical protein